MLHKKQFEKAEALARDFNLDIEVRQMSIIYGVIKLFIKVIGSLPHAWLQTTLPRPSAPDAFAYFHVFQQSDMNSIIYFSSKYVICIRQISGYFCFVYKVDPSMIDSLVPHFP